MPAEVCVCGGGDEIWRASGMGYLFPAEFLSCAFACLLLNAGGNVAASRASDTEQVPL